MSNTNHELCKTCGTKLVQRETKKKASQLRQPYYYTAYYYCPKCQKIYHNDKFKVINGHNLQLPLDEVQGLKEDVDAEIWTDGACTFNGRENARAAWAFVSGDTEKAGLVIGKQTNNVAEAQAIFQAVQWAAEKGYKSIRIYSDSQITIHNLQKQPELIKQNQEIFQKIGETIKQNELKVYYEKVIGHSGNIGNERADKLAKDFATKT